MPKAVKYLLWVVLIFAIFAVFRSPDDAAGLVAGAIDGVLAAINSIFEFFDAMLAEFTN